MTTPPVQTQDPSPHRIEVDVLVVGGGSAGSTAAVAAARRGMTVLLVEEANCLGGVSTHGGVNEWWSNLEGIGDIYPRVCNEVRAFGGVYGRFYNPEYLKMAWQAEVDRVGVDVLFHASLLDVETDGRRLVSARVLAASHVVEVTAKWFIDSTGEGDLAAAAGASFMKGHPESGLMLHMTLTAVLLDADRPIEPHLPEGYEPIETAEDLPGLNARLKLPDGRVYVSMTKVMGHDSTDPVSLSRAEAEARRQLIRVLHFLQRFEFPNHVVGSTGGSIGIREGRRILGDYVITEDDVLGDHTDFDDGVAVATALIDFHSLSRKGNLGWRHQVKPYALPLRAMIARDLDNLLMAGKCISGEQSALASYRMTPTCAAMGQAVGTAVSVVDPAAGDIRSVDVPRLRATLTADSMELDPRKHKPFAPKHDVNFARAEAD